MLKIFRGESTTRLAQGVAGIGLVALGLFGLSALAGAGPDVIDSAAARTSAPVVLTGQENTPSTGSESTVQDGDFQDRVKDMIQEHMGLTGEEADRWANEMAEHMTAVHGEDAGDMLDWCSQAWDGDGTTTGGMMGGGTTGGMMGGSGGGMMGGSGGGMMGGSGGGMMGGSGGGMMGLGL
ncbi:MAG: hypothetical protein M5U22_21585 [Thermoleophilia bacterium]|nr:hypothetical protein [Thermoleophilia bacterium]